MSSVTASPKTNTTTKPIRASRFMFLNPQVVTRTCLKNNRQISRLDLQKKALNRQDAKTPGTAKTAKDSKG
jgi:hypothetical protein